jgi:hypothetical protein
LLVGDAGGAVYAVPLLRHAVREPLLEVGQRDRGALPLHRRPAYGVGTRTQPPRRINPQ